MAMPIIFTGFDRIQIAFSEMLSDTAIDRVAKHCGKPPQVTLNAGGSPADQLTIDFFQPRPKAFRILCNAIGTEVFSRVTDTELVLDVLFDHPAAAQHFMDHLLGRIWWPRLRANEYMDHGTFYFAPKFTKGGQRTAFRPVIYADRASKLPGAPPQSNCLHIEMRLNGAHAVRSVGIASIDDALHFDHEAYWARACEIYPRASATGLGRLIRDPHMRAVSDEMYRRRGNEFVDEVVDSIETSGHQVPPFVFQKAARLFPALRERQKPIGIFQWLASLDAAWKPSRKPKKTLLI